LAKPARLMCMIMQCVITYCNLNFFDGMISVVYSICKYMVLWRNTHDNLLKLLRFLSVLLLKWILVMFIV